MKTVVKDKSKALIVGNTVYPVTKYMMNYVAFLCDYRESLVNIMLDALDELLVALLECGSNEKCFPFTWLMRPTKSNCGSNLV